MRYDDAVRPFLLTLAVIAGLAVLSALPLIPELAPLRQGSTLSIGLVCLSLLVVNTKRRWAALPDLRRAIAMWNGLAAVVCLAGVLACMMNSSLSGVWSDCSVRVSQLMYAPADHVELISGRTTYRFTERCDERETTYLQQARFIFIVAPKVL